MAVSFNVVVGDAALTSAGEKSHETPAGRPEQLNETDWLKPLVGAMVRVVVTDWP